MKAMVTTEYSGPQGLVLQDVAMPVPYSGEVLIRVVACSINDWDLGLIKGDAINRLINGLTRPKRVPIVGSDVAGEVVEVGSGVTTLKPGDRVYGDLSNQGFGGFAEYVCAKVNNLALIPKAMSFEQAAAIPQAGVLATQALLDIGQVKAGQSVLINGAGGGVGTLGIQVLKAIGNIKVTGVDSGLKLNLMRKLGFDDVIDYTQEDFTGRNEQYDLIVDTKTTRSPWCYLQALKSNGVYVTVGGNLGRLAQLALTMWFINLCANKKLKVVALKPNKDLPYYNSLFDAGKLAPLIDGPYPLTDLPDVFDRYIRGLQMGKMVVRMN